MVAESGKAVDAGRGIGFHDIVHDLRTDGGDGNTTRIPAASRSAMNAFDLRPAIKPEPHTVVDMQKGRVITEHA